MSDWVNFSFIVYIPVTGLSIWQYFDPSPVIYAALVASASTALLMHIRDSLESYVKRHKERAVAGRE